MIRKKVYKTAAAVLTLAMFAGCGSGKNDSIPYPDDFYVKPAETETETGEDETEDADETVEETVGETAEAETEAERKKVINYFLDCSGSIPYASDIVTINAAAIKCAAGFECHFYGVDGKKLTETSEQLALSGKYTEGAPVDLLKNGTLPYDPEGVNIITTDMQSEVTGSELGEWLADTGCTGYSLYIFDIAYDGNLQFFTNTTAARVEEVTVKDVSFTDKEFLMIAFGDDDLVSEFDASFANKFSGDLSYENCHASMTSEEDTESFLKLASAPWFKDDIANITSGNTNYVFGLAGVDTEGTEFTCENTFVYTKSSKSVGNEKDTVKAVLYTAIDDETVPEVDDVKITVRKYNEETDRYEDTEAAAFDVTTEGLLDGLPTLTEEAAENLNSKAYDHLTEKLGGSSIAAEGPVFVTTVSNEEMPGGLYAVEVKISFAREEETEDLQSFGTEHSAGLEEYTAELNKNCKADRINGKESSTSFTFSRKDVSESPFRKLLDFEKVTDQLAEAGAAVKQENKQVLMRLVIDNR